MHVQIQASIPNPMDVLQAESLAAVLAARISAFLRMQQITFMTDSEKIVKCFDAYRNTHNISDWKLRPLIAEFQAGHDLQHISVLKISRSSNRLADSIAKQARQVSPLGPCLFSCQATHSSNQCYILQSLCSFNWGYFSPLSVICS